MQLYAAHGSEPFWVFGGLKEAKGALRGAEEVFVGQKEANGACRGAAGVLGGMK